MAQVTKFEAGRRARITINKTPREIKPSAPAGIDDGFIRSPYSMFDDPVRDRRARVRFFDIGTRFEHVDPNARIGWARVFGSSSVPELSGFADYLNAYLELDVESDLLTTTRYR